jgi:AraC-like DNA-binding protein
MHGLGLTKARSMGPVAQLVQRSGGSVARVFRRAELPMRLVEEPDRLILLRDQLKLVECAAREIGDEALPARLSTEGGFGTLGAYGRLASAAEDLDAAIACASATIGPLLQSATQFTQTRAGRYTKWTYRVTDPVPVGRQKNEILALGYMLDLVRKFAGPGWTPPRAEVGGPPPPGRTGIEDIFRCELHAGEEAAIVFPTGFLEMPNPQLADARAPYSANPGTPEAASTSLPAPEDIVACVEHLIGLALLERRPTIDWLCRHLGVSRRSLQRRLARRGSRFDALLHQALATRAAERLRAGASATDVAYELGYGDPAHFTRAFRRWTGRTPRQWRNFV